MFTCPVCFYEGLQEPPTDYNICDCCGTEFESDDEIRTYQQLRDFWISKGAKWFFGTAPLLWNPWVQLSRAGVNLPYTALQTGFVTASYGYGPYGYVPYGSVPDNPTVSQQPAPIPAQPAEQLDLNQFAKAA
jgi:hypothetical protein